MSDTHQFPRGHKLSESAAEALHEFKAELNAWPAYVQRVSSSTAIELLCWYWKMARREGKTEVDPLEHEPSTRCGRKPGRDQMKNARPSSYRPRPHKYWDKIPRPDRPDLD